MSELGTERRPLRVAVVGSGPSGFYAAEALLKSDPVVQVDLFDRLPTPYGLVRAGVAPDHPKLKNVIRVYEKLAQKEGLAFLGNVQVGRDVSVDELRRFYDAVIFTCGSETDRKLGIPGEDLDGSYTATEFVGWYNAHPDYRDRTFNLSAEVAVVIGQGNVAMDVSRILAKTVDELRETDIAEHALEALAGSRVREIYVVGRRGPVQAKFTPPEIREIGQLADCEPVVDPVDLELDDASRQELEDSSNKQARQNFEILKDFASREPAGKTKRYHLRFRESPVRLEGTERVERVVLEKNELSGEPFRIKAKGTGVLAEVDCGLFFRSIGYHGLPMPGVPFDEKQGVFPNDRGRILEEGVAVPGLYAAGWIKRGPSGVIGTNKPDAYETVEALVEDVPALEPCPTPDTNALVELLRSRNVRVVNFDDWRIIDAAEIERGKPKGKPREKYLTIEEMLDLLE